jgi:hypothetical protein
MIRLGIHLVVFSEISDLFEMRWLFSGNFGDFLKVLIIGVIF